MSEFYSFLALVFFGYLFAAKRNYMNRHFLLFLWNFLGVVLHELSHYIVALLLNGKPELPSLIPKREVYYKGGMEHTLWILGHVKVRNLNSFNKFFIGLAPALILIPSAFYIYLYFFDWFKYDPRNLFLFYLILYLLLYNAMPSSQDLKIASEGYLGFFVFLCVLLFYLANIN